MKRYRNSRVTILACSLLSEGGDWRSIYFFAKQLEARGDSVAIVRLGGKRGFRQMVAAALFAPRLLVNGLSSLGRWSVLALCLFRRDARIYLHETGYALDQFQQEHPLSYRLLSRVLRHNLILCVSKQAEAHYQERFGSTQTHVVYECPGDVEPPVLDPSKKHIVMVGSMNERKGVELFSRVADLAADSYPEWQFHWVGSLATMNPIYRSNRVLWHGWQWVPGDIVAKCDLFFLSSIDDPCPLSALEAGSMGKRLVAYRGTGTAEIIENLRGCRVFDHYDAESVISAIEGSLGDGVDVEESIRRALKSISSIEAFAARIDQALS